MKAAIRSKAICVLGMHRSGTSTLSRAINLLGAYLGEENELYGPAPDNPEGYWERKEFVDFHDRLLGKLKRTWDTTTPLPDHWYLEKELQQEREELSAMIRDSFSGHELWGWKDPRTCILLPLWKHLLGELGIDLSAVFVVRHPFDVATSLIKRDGFTVGKSFGIWFNYNLTALRSVSDIPTAFVSYDRFLENSENELKRCSSELGIKWPDDDTELRNNLQTFVRPDLRHSRTASTNIQTSPAPVQTLFSFLSHALQNPTLVNRQFYDDIEQLYSQFSSYAGFYQSEQMNLWDKNQQISKQQQSLLLKQALLDQRDMQITERDSQLAESHERLSKYKKLLDERGKELAEWGELLAECKQQLSKQNRRLAGLDAQLAELQKQLIEREKLLSEHSNMLDLKGDLLAQREFRIQELEASYSWRITAPFRWLATRLMVDQKSPEDFQ